MYIYFNPFIVYVIFQTTKIQKQKLFPKNFCDSHESYFVESTHKPEYEKGNISTSVNTFTFDIQIRSTIQKIVFENKVIIHMLSMFLYY